MRRVPKDIFKGTAGWYSRYRPPYPRGLFRYLARTFRMDGTGRLLDLGCGTGELTLPLARYFRQAIGVDSEAAMITAAKWKARRAGVRNTRWITGKAESVIPKVGPVRLSLWDVPFIG